MATYISLDENNIILNRTGGDDSFSHPDYIRYDGSDPAKIRGYYNSSDQSITPEIATSTETELPTELLTDSLPISLSLVSSVSWSSNAASSSVILENATISEFNCSGGELSCLITPVTPENHNSDIFDIRIQFDSASLIDETPRYIEFYDWKDATLGALSSSFAS